MYAAKALLAGQGSSLLEGRQTGLAYDVTSLARGRVQLDHRRDRERRRVLLVGSNIRWEAPLIATRVRKVARKGGKVFAIGPEVDLGMKVEWLGNDLKLLGKLPKEVSDAFAAAERPAVIVGAGALAAGALGAALALVEPLGLIKDGWNGFNVLHMAASRMAALMLGYAQTGGIADLEAAKPEARAAARRRRGRPPTGSRARSRSTSATTATPARSRPTWSCRARPMPRSTAPTSTPRAGCSASERAVFPPGEAREDWAILRAVSRARRQDAAVRQLRPAARGDGRGISRSSAATG